jgi:ankyrin repeat protein
MLPSKYDQRLPPWLLKHGANPDLPDGYGTSPMYFVAGYGSVSILQLLFDYGAKVDNNALFAIIREKKRHDPEKILIMELLLSKGADVNFLHEYERRLTSSALIFARRFRHTPLWEAVKAKDVKIVELLIRNGADVNLKILVNGVEKSSPLEEMLASKSLKMRDIGGRLNEGGSVTYVEGGVLGDH